MVDDASQSVLAWLRTAREATPPVAVVCNFTPGAARGLPHRPALPGAGARVLNTDAALYGGSNMGNLGGVTAEARPAPRLPCSATVTLPPLATLFLVFSPPAPEAASDDGVRDGQDENGEGAGRTRRRWRAHAMAYVLAGGRGSRLMELTDRRAKPAVYFGGKSRIIDFALSNALNSGIRRIAVATQYKAHSLIRHLQRGWNFLRPERNESFDILPASQRVVGDQWYAGTADAVYQNIDIIESYAPEYIVILAGDHIYKMDYEQMLQQHVDAGADVTVGCIEVPLDGGDRLRRDACRRQRPHHRRSSRSPTDPPRACRASPDVALASMGIYVFDDDVPDRPAAARRRRSEFEPRFRQGHHPVPGRRTARRWRTASRNPACTSSDGGRGLLARRRHASTPTGRPTST